MNRLCLIYQERVDSDTVLRDFFYRVREAKRTLDRVDHLNRLQRDRCKYNLLELSKLEMEFRKIDYSEDYYEMHKLLNRYLYLSVEDLISTLGYERVEIRSLFII